uniref:Uncharacterized protein n=1 Tax=Brassica oleracea var. oleracea TaxID=109376 RepID=A0A0D3BH90_BRAOL
MFRERHRLMLRHGKMKSLRCVESPSSCVESPLRGVHSSCGWSRGLLGRYSGHKSGMGVFVEQDATTKSHSRRVIIRHTCRGRCREEE